MTATTSCYAEEELKNKTCGPLHQRTISTIVGEQLSNKPQVACSTSYYSSSFMQNDAFNVMGEMLLFSVTLTRHKRKLSRGMRASYQKSRSKVQSALNIEAAAAAAAAES
jgi:hypothetical protein